MWGRRVLFMVLFLELVYLLYRRRRHALLSTHAAGVYQHFTPAFLDMLYRTGELARLHGHACTHRYLPFDEFRTWLARPQRQPLAQIVGSPAAWSVVHLPCTVWLLQYTGITLAQRCVLGAWACSTVSTEDGPYRIWSRECAGSSPIVFFPGIGAGVLPYCRYRFPGRSVHVVEVPNIAGLTLRQSHRTCTGATLARAVRSVVPAGSVFDVVAHSLGTYHAAMVVNALPPGSVGRVVLHDPFCHPVHLLRTQACVYGLPMVHSSCIGWMARHLVGRNLEVQAFSHCNGSGCLLWDLPRCGPVLSIFSREDAFIDYRLFTSYLQDTAQEHVIVPGNHGGSVHRAGKVAALEFLARVNPP